ncbi:hypothetical protein D3C87_948310 [compost metagenome]
MRQLSAVTFVIKKGNTKLNGTDFSELLVWTRDYDTFREIISNDTRERLVGIGNLKSILPGLGIEYNMYDYFTIIDYVTESCETNMYMILIENVKRLNDTKIDCMIILHSLKYANISIKRKASIYLDQWMVLYDDIRYIMNEYENYGGPEEDVRRWIKDHYGVSNYEERPMNLNVKIDFTINMDLLKLILNWNTKEFIVRRKIIKEKSARDHDDITDYIDVTESFIDDAPDIFQKYRDFPIFLEKILNENNMKDIPGMYTSFGYPYNHKVARLYLLIHPNDANEALLHIEDPIERMEIVYRFPDTNSISYCSFFQFCFSNELDILKFIWNDRIDNLASSFYYISDDVKMILLN